MSGGHVLPPDTSDATLEVVGGKGRSLAAMLSAGMDVPDGFYVTTSAYRQYVGRWQPASRHSGSGEAESQRQDIVFRLGVGRYSGVVRTGAAARADCCRDSAGLCLT